jgi:hypothetical protein
MSAVNAFDWKKFTDEEHAKNGDPFKEIKRSAVISKNVTDGMDKVREKNPTHGTIFGITEKRLSLRAPDMITKRGNGDQLRSNKGQK